MKDFMLRILMTIENFFNLFLELDLVGWLFFYFFCLTVLVSLRQYFSLYRAVSQTEGEREEKG